MGRASKDEKRERKKLAERSFFEGPWLESTWAATRKFRPSKLQSVRPSLTGDTENLTARLRSLRLSQTEKKGAGVTRF